MSSEMKVIYVIGPFRGRNGWEVAENIRDAERVGMLVAEAGAMPLIPHANTGSFDRTLSDKFWLRGTFALARRCDAAITVTAIGKSWSLSEGSLAEVEYFREAGLPVFHGIYNLRTWLGTFK